MDGWKVERQTQSLSQSSTRVLQSQNVRVSTNLIQGKLPMIMDDPQWSQKMSQSAAAERMRKKLESVSFGDANELNFNSLLNGAGMMSTEGFSMTTTASVATRTEQAQIFASSRSSSLQSQGMQAIQGMQGMQTIQGMHGMHAIQGIPRLQGMQGMIPTSNSWLNMNLEGGIKEMAATSTVSASSATTATAVGVTRSFSSSSGFPPVSSGSLNELKELNNSAITTSEHSSEIPSLENFVSPFRRAPFGFRNFDRPLWTDMPLNIKDNHNRMTWDPSTMLTSTMKSSSSQVQFSASQHTVFESSNGSFRAFKDQKVILRQSYGASESESDDEDDDDDIGGIKSITYRQKPALPYQPKLAITDKPHYAPSEADDSSSVAPSDLDQSPRNSILESEGPITPEHRKCHKVAQELLTTERTYVKILHLIDQIFHFRVDQENRVQTMFPPDTVTQMFCNIKSLYQLHHDHLLPQLELRLANWEEDPRIGDIMKDFAPFLKMYSEYVQNFDNSINLINVYREKNIRFANIINEIQKMEECGNLPIQHHLIGPIQRIPRYRLLLEAYLRKLSDDSKDRQDTEKALEIVSKAAEHANDAMRRIVGFKKLLEVQEKVKGAVDLVSPTRVFLKEGKISKISARTSDHQERYIFLFSDMVLLCSTRPMANRMIFNAPYQLRAKLDVGEMTVNEGDDLEVVNTFYIEDTHKKIELYTTTSEEKRVWMEAMYQARVDLLERKSSLRLGSVSPSEDELGLKEPAKIKSDSVSKCMECHTAFTMLKRRHHCHACGGVVCAKCSGAKLPLQYAGGKFCRVCKTCKNVLQDKNVPQKKNCNSDPSSPDEPVEKMRGVLDVPASVPAVLSGYLSLRLRGKKEWISRWFALRTDFVLYCYAKDTDEQSMTATPIPGMSVLMADDLPKSDTPNLPSGEKERAFRIAHGHGRKYFFFLASSREEALNWVQRLQLAGKAELNNVNANANNQP